MVQALVRERLHTLHGHIACFRQALVSGRMNEELGNLLEDVVRVVNDLKNRPLKGRLFALLCKDFGTRSNLFICHVTALWNLCLMENLWNHFGCKLKATSYPSLSTKASDILVRFATSYLCESGFSSVVVLKTIPFSLSNRKGITDLNFIKFSKIWETAQRIKHNHHTIR